MPHISKCIPTFLPVIEQDSTILPRLGFMMISLHLPSLLRLREWKRLFSIENDGTAMRTFYSNVQEHDDTVMLIQDEDNRIFGAYSASCWEMQRTFFGTGQNFIFSFDISRQ